MLIPILVFLVLGAFVAAEAPHSGSKSSNAANFSMKESESTAAVQHAQWDKTVLPEIHSHAASGNAQTGVKRGHHAG